MTKPLVNRIKKSGLITLDLEEFMPGVDIATLDLQDFLYKGLLLKEKEYRTAVNDHKWGQYTDKVLCVTCSTDAIVPNWAYMLIAENAFPYATEVFNGTSKDWLKMAYRNILDKQNWNEYDEAKIVIKGCGDANVPADAYIYVLNCLMPHASSVMFGEACSAVPVFKNRK